MRVIAVLQLLRQLLLLEAQLPAQAVLLAPQAPQTRDGKYILGFTVHTADVYRLASHYQWVIFLVVMAVGIPVVWVAAWYFRRQHIRKRDGALEKQNPIALGPHQVQGMTGGYMSSETIAGHQIVGHHPAPGMAGAYTSNATLASQTGPGAVGPSPLGRGLRKERK